MFACKFCTETFDNRDELADHLTDAHDAFSDVMAINAGVKP